MDIKLLRRKTSEIRTYDQLRRYYDAELFLDFEMIDSPYVSLPFKELITTTTAQPSLFRGEEIFPVHTFSNKDQFYLWNVAHKTHVQVGINQLPTLNNLDSIYIRSDFWQFRDSENIGCGPVAKDTPFVTLRSLFGRELHLGRSPKATRRILRYWQIVKGLQALYTEPDKFVVPSSRVPSFESIVPSLSFESFKEKGLSISYPFLYDTEQKARMFVDGKIPDPLVDEITEYTDDLRHQYYEKVTQVFARLPDEYADILLNFIHDHCDDCVMMIVVSDRGVSVRRGIDYKLLPYFDKMFEEQDNDAIVSIFR